MEKDHWTFGTTRRLFVEYLKRSEPYTMQFDHFHSYFEIYYLLSGSRIYFVRDRTYRVEQGDLVFIPRNVLHKTLQAGDPAHERIVIHFDEPYLTQLAGPHSGLLLEPFAYEGAVIRLPGAEQRAADQLLRRALGEIRGKPPGYELVPTAAVTELLLLVARYLRENTPVPVEGDTSPRQAKISEIVRYLNAHYDEPLKLGEIAERFFVSPYHLSRTFKEVTGFTYSDYLTLTRIKEAQRLLRDTDRTVADIAAASGFDNISHFGKMFKKIARLSPRDYRKGEYIE